jgi:WD40 repeat protein
VRLWDLRHLNDWISYREPPVPPAVLFKHDHPVRTAALDRKEGRVLTCDAGGEAHLRDAKDGRLLRSFRHGRGANGAAFHPGKERIVTWGEGGVKVWDADNGEALATLANEAEVRGVTFDAGGAHLLAWDVDYTARWWDLERGKAVHEFTHRRDLFGAALDAGGARALTWGLDGDARVWDVTTGKLVRTFEHGRPVAGAAFAPGEDRVWAWTAEGFSEWDIKTGKRLRLLKPQFTGYPDERVRLEGLVTAEPSRDGRRFLLADPEGMIHYWDAASQREVPPRRNPYTKDDYRGRFHAAFNADQTRAAALGPEETVLLYDLRSGLQLQVFRHDKAVRGFAFGRDGTRLLTWSDDGTARLWQTEAPRPWAADDQLLELEVRSGFRVDEFGRLESLSQAQWQTRRERLEGTVRKKYER